MPIPICSPKNIFVSPSPSGLNSRFHWPLSYRYPTVAVTQSPFGFRASDSSRSSSSSLKFAAMENGGSPCLFPFHRCKTIHLVRHAQGTHNVEGDKNYKAYMSPEYFDANLTQLGWQQVDNLRRHVLESGLLKKVELVVTSPLLRTMQTAVGVFGGGDYTDRMDILPLMVANAGNSERAAISSLNCPPILAVELCREHLIFCVPDIRFFGHSIRTKMNIYAFLCFMFTFLLTDYDTWYRSLTSFYYNKLKNNLGIHPCDKRRSISEYQCLFPAVDFSLIESDEDALWKVDVRETKEELAARGMNFLIWLLSRKEKEIAVVTHSGFLYHTLAAFGNDCHPLVKREISKHFANCELRSLIIVDRSMMGLDIPATNYPGNIPSGRDLPSDVADEKNQEKEIHK